jgi:hypothetical protein
MFVNHEEKKKLIGSDLVKQELSSASTFEDTTSVKLGNTNYLVKKNEVVQYMHNDTRLVIPLAPAPASTALSNSNAMELRINKGMGGSLSRPVLRFRFQNTSGTQTVTPARIAGMWDRFEIWAKDNAYLVQRISGQALWQFLCTAIYTDEEWQTIAALQNTTTSFGSGTAIPISTVRDFYLPLWGTVLNKNKINLKYLKQDLVLRMFPVGDGGVAAGTGILALIAVDLLFDCEAESPNSEKLLSSVHTSPNTTIQRLFLDNITINYPNSTLTANQESTFSLRALTGKCAFLIVSLRASTGGTSSTNDGYTTYTAIENTNNNEGSLDIIDEKGSQLLASGATIFAADLRFIESIRHHQSRFYQNVPSYLIPFCRNVKKTCFSDEERIDGCMLFTGTDMLLRITPNGSIANSGTAGAYIVNIQAFIWKKLNIQNGDISVALA